MKTSRDFVVFHMELQWNPDPINFPSELEIFFLKVISGQNQSSIANFIALRRPINSLKTIELLFGTRQFSSIATDWAVYFVEDSRWYAWLLNIFSI